MADSMGERFAQAVATKDHAALCGLLAAEVDFKALTPRRFWEAATPQQVSEVFATWFDADDHIEELVRVDTDTVVDSERVGYRLRLKTPDGDFGLEQQAYYRTADGRISWLRIMCSGFRPLPDGE